VCVNMQNFVKSGQTVLEIAIFPLSRWPLSVVLCFQIFHFFVDDRVTRANLHSRTKFRQNQSNGCRNSGFIKVTFRNFEFLFKFKFLNSC